MSESVGPSADEFLLKVQNATAGPPWFKTRSDLVSLCICAAMFRSVYHNVIGNFESRAVLTLLSQ